MNTLFASGFSLPDFFNDTLLSEPINQRLALTLAHFLWQGAVIAFVAWLLSVALKRGSATARHTVFVATLVIMLACVPATYCLLDSPLRVAPESIDHALAENSFLTRFDLAEGEFAGNLEAASFDPALTDIPTQESETAVVSPASQPVATGSWSGLVGSLISNAAPHATALYFAGVFLMCLRVLLAIIGGHRLRKSATEVDNTQLIELVEQLSQQMHIRVAPQIAYCQRQAVPVVVGIFSPMILLPVSIASGMNEHELRAILAHEMAHIRRYDPLINLFQRMVETLLFFHPAVWFVSYRIGVERENCCDDSAVAAGQGSLAYAGVLLRMAEICIANGQSNDQKTARLSTLSADGNNPSELKRRVLRLLQVSDTPRIGLSRPILSVAITLTLSVATFAVIAQDQAKPSTDAVEIEDGDESSKTEDSEETVKDKQPKVESVWRDAITGIVTDDDGKPLANANVRLTAVSHFRSGSIDEASKSLGVTNAKTNAKGKYTLDATAFDEPINGRPYSMISWAAKDNYAPTKSWWFMSDHQEKCPKAFGPHKMPRGRLVTGRVLSETGEPIIGATIGGSCATDPRFRWYVDEPLTGMDGRFEFLAPIDSALTLHFASKSAGFQTIEVDAEQEDVGDVKLPGGTSLKGKVLSVDGSPVAGVVVALKQQNRLKNRPHAVTVQRLATLTAADGTFRLPPVKGGFVCFLSNASYSDELDDESGEKGCVFATRKIPAVFPRFVELGGFAAGKQITIQEAETVTLTGRALKKDGSPRPDSSFQAYSHWDGYKAHFTYAEVECDKDGRFQFEIPIGASPLKIYPDRDAKNEGLMPVVEQPRKSRAIAIEKVTVESAKVDIVFQEQ